MENNRRELNVEVILQNHMQYCGVFYYLKFTIPSLYYNL